MKVIIDFNLVGYVEFEVNASLDILLEIMCKSKVYVHPKPDEPFVGISTLKAMSTGLIPIVPSIGGHTEFVPQKYHFFELVEAAKKYLWH
jgi:glycosyltransferase involved in cell wall biosynthesis